MTKKATLLMVLMLVLSAVWAQGVDFVQRGADIVVAAHNDDYALLHTDDGYLALQAAGYDHLDLGHNKPLIPHQTRVFSIPSSATFSLNILAQDTISILLDAKIKPSAGPNIKDSEPLPTAVTKEHYGSGWLFDSPISVERLGTLGAQQLLRVTVVAANYLPEANKLLIYRNLEATIHINVIGSQQPDQAAAERIAIVVPPDFARQAATLAQWKMQEGYDVVVVAAESNDANSIKAALQQLHDSATPLTPSPNYIILIGDVDRIKAFTGRYNLPGEGYHRSDMYFGEFTGDYLPEALVGRLSVRDSAELAAVVGKIIAYEQLQYSSTIVEKAMLVAGREDRQPAPLTTNGQVNYLKTQFHDAGLDTLCYYNPTSELQRSDIIADISRGPALVNYTAHCYENAWVRPSLTVAQLDTLGFDRPSVFVNNCCSSNDFFVDCLGESLLRKPAGGAVGVIGATDLTLWEEDYYWSIGYKHPLSETPPYTPQFTGAFDALLSSQATLGEMLVAGNMAVTLSGSPYDTTYWEIYSILGDPTLRPSLGTLGSLDLYATGAAQSGATSLVAKSTPGAKVSAVQDGKLLAVGAAGADSTALLAFRAPINTEPILITATMFGYRPAFDTITVAPSAHGRATITNATLTDTLVDITLRNVGSLPIVRHSVRVAQTTADSSWGNHFAPAELTIGNLLPGCDTIIALPIVVAQRGGQWLAAHVDLYDEDDSLYSSTPLCYKLDFARPRVALTIADGNGNQCQQLERNSSYSLQFVLENNPDSANISVATLPPHTTIDTTLSAPNATLGMNVPDSATHIIIYVTLHRGLYIEHDTLWLAVDESGEGFESSDFASYPWHQPAVRPWTIDSIATSHGLFCARSGEVDNRQTSDLQITIHNISNDSISFFCKTSSQAGDVLTFSIDGAEQARWSGRTTWQRATFGLAAGQHTLRWRYVKDESGSDGDDCAWIDHIEWPLVAWTSECGWFGDSDTANNQADTNLALTSLWGAERWAMNPNPATSNVLFTVPEPCTITLFDLVGNRLDELKIEKIDTPTQYFTTKLRYGIYIVTFKNAGNTITKKLSIIR